MAHVLDSPRHASKKIDEPAPTITTVPPIGAQKLERRITLVVTILPFLGLLVAIRMLWGSHITVVDIGIAVGMYAITALGITIGFHRLLTHRSFDAVRPIQVAFAVMGSMAMQGPVIRWVADHRRHHAFADLPGDPHSPHLEEAQGIKGVLVGLWHAHVGWLFDIEKTRVRRFAPDLLKDATIRKIDRLFPLWALLSFAIPPALGFALTRTASGALTAFIWGSLVRMFFVHHVTWSINSICHFYGKRPFENRDFSTNNWLLSLVSFGEAWHNNHHAFPSSAVHGLLKGQLDLSGLLIRGFSKLGLASNLRVPSDEDIRSKLIASS